jgi:hypothetical protein
VDVKAPKETTMKKILLATTASLFMISSAFAQSSALDVRSKFMEYSKDDPSVVEMMFNEDGTDRAEDDYSKRMAAATPKQKEMMVAACTQAEKDKVGFSDMVVSRCKAAGGAAQ